MTLFLKKPLDYKTSERVKIYNPFGKFLQYQLATYVTISASVITLETYDVTRWFRWVGGPRRFAARSCFRRPAGIVALLDRAPRPRFLDEAGRMDPLIWARQPLTRRDRNNCRMELQKCPRDITFLVWIAQRSLK